MGDTEGKTSALISEDDFVLLEQRLNEFCPFEAVGMVNAEIRHGNFLAYVLNPFRPHGFKSALLSAFLNCVARHAPAIETMGLNVGDAEVRREWRSIDLLIILPSAKMVLPIELKIDAVQGAGQLQRYRQIVEANWPSSEGWRHFCIFLTKRHEEPEDDSWLPVRLRDLVADFELAEASAGATVAGLPMLGSYLRMIRRRHLGNKDLEEIARRLWSKHEDALNFLASRRPAPLRDLFDTLKETDRYLAKALTAPGRTVVTDKHANDIIRFAFAEWDSLDGFLTSTWTPSKRLVLLEVKYADNKIDAFLHIGPGTTDAQEQYGKVLFDNRLDHTARRLRKDWTPLAHTELFNFKDGDDIDIDVASDTMSKRLQVFAERVFSHFDPLLRTIGP